MFHNRVAYLWVQQGHDAFCDALHLDQAVFPVSRVLHRDTGAQRVITQGKITAPISSSSNKLTSKGRGEDFASMNDYINHVG